MKDIMIGDIFYKKDNNGNVDIIRIKKFKNSKVVSVLRDTELYSMAYNTILNEYTRLNPHGYITFNIVSMQDTKDVIVTLTRRNDVIFENDNVPYATCRQNIANLFAEQIIINSDIHFVGISITKDTTPEDVPYEMVLACDGLISSDTISYYIDDTLDTILSFIKQDKYDNILKTNNKNIDSNVIGYCNSLKELLIENDFMYDVHTAFTIIEVEFETEILEDGSLPKNQREYIEDMLKTEMYATYVIKYDKDIDLSEIKRNHILMCDKNNEIYILGFDKGNYINRTYLKYIRDKRDMKLMLKMVSKNTKK